jgi:uncharacterized membrane protein YdfJ with MMPL/SSD domain
VELRRLAVDAETLLRVSDEFAESVRIPAGGHRLAPDGGGALAHLATVVFAVCLAAVVLLVVCLGVLLDTLLVRTVLVPALAFVLGDRFWWPGRIRDTPVEAVTVPA